MIRKPWKYQGFDDNDEDRPLAERYKDLLEFKRAIKRKEKIRKGFVVFMNSYEEMMKFCRYCKDFSLGRESVKKYVDFYVENFVFEDKEVLYPFFIRYLEEGIEREEKDRKLYKGYEKEIELFKGYMKWYSFRRERESVESYIRFFIKYYTKRRGNHFLNLLTFCLYTNLYFQSDL